MRYGGPDGLHPSGRARPIKGMRVDVGAWLRGLGLGKYEQAFRDNDIDAGLLPTLAADDLRELGVVSLGHRKLLLAASFPSVEDAARGIAMIEACLESVRRDNWADARLAI
jgi:hypothetical protein